METNKQKQASARIRFALWRASRKAGCPTDYREMDLTQEQAVFLLKQFNEKTGYNKQQSSSSKEHKPVKSMTEQEKKQMYRTQFIEFFKKNYLDKAVALFNDVLKIESQVYAADIFGNDLGGKRYKFYGSGCACGWLVFRKCEKYKIIYAQACSAFNHECKDLFIAQINPKIIKQLKEDGIPIGAIYSQDYQFRELELDCVKKFLEKNGAKDIERHIHYD